MNTITVVELKERLASGENIYLVDVREPEENSAFNIGGKLIPLRKIMALQTDEIDDIKDEEIICYCRSGQRSMQACAMLEAMGFTNVKNLIGGMLKWQELNSSSI